MLLVLPSRETPANNIIKWFGILSDKIARLCEVVPVEHCSPNSSAFVLEFHGERVAEKHFGDATETVLLNLFHSMVDFVERGRSVDLAPDFRPSLSWYSDAEGHFLLFTSDRYGAFA